MRLIRIGEAARLLGVDAQALRRRAQKGDGDYMMIFGHRLRVFKMDTTPGAERRFDADEVARIAARLQKR